MYLSKFNYNVLFAASTLFKFSFCPILVQPTKFPQAQFKKNNDLLTSKGYIVQYLFWKRPLRKKPLYLVS